MDRRPRAAALLLALIGGLTGALLGAPSAGPSLRAARADDDPAGEHGPRLHVEDKTLLFDEVIQGAVLDLTIAVNNRGDAPLRLTRAEPSCGCTVLPLPEAPIPPGGQAELTIRFDSAEKLGAQSLQILLYSNDPTQTDLGRYCTRLFVQGDVRSLYRVTPVGAFFGEFVRGVEAQERVVTVTGVNEARRGFVARVEGAAPDYLEVTPEPVPGGEGGRPKGLHLRVRLLPHAPVGELSHVVELVTDIPEQPRVRVAVVGIVVDRIVAPEALHLGRITRVIGAERRAPVERRDGAEGLRVLRVESDLPWLELGQEPMNEQRVDLVVRVPADAPPGPFAGTLRVILDDPRLPLLQVPVFGQVLPRVTAEPPLVRLGEAAEVVLRGGRVTGVRIEPAEAGVRAELLLPGPTTRVRLVGPPTRPCRLVVETDVPGEERLLIEVEPLPPR